MIVNTVSRNEVARFFRRLKRFRSTRHPLQQA